MTSTVIEYLKRSKVPVVIFGAGIVGEVMFYACRDAGIKVECFCDNNINKSRSPKCGLEVVPTAELKARYHDVVILISAADIKDVVAQLQLLGYLQWHASGLLLREYDIYRHEYSVPMDFVEYAVATCLFCHDSYLTPGKLFMRSVDIIITERCSLKCRDCSNLMQYYQKPVDCETGEVLKSIDLLCSYADEINEFRVIGGEPFMNKEFNVIIDKLVGQPRVRKIVIYTNGTISPKPEKLECLKHDKILLIITDYGALARRLAAFTELLRQNKISFYLQKAKGWTDCAKIIKFGRNDKEQKELFASCCAKNTLTLSAGRLYRCPFSANATRLKAVPDSQKDHLDLLTLSEKNTGADQVKKMIREFLLDKESLETCDYCQGRPFGAPEIEPAVQTAEPLKYERNQS